MFSFLCISDTKPPAVKKRRVGGVIARSPLLECSSEIMRNVYSFLTLKDSLEVRRTCHELHDGNMDVFQYSNLESFPIFPGIPKWKYQCTQRVVLCILDSADKLRKLLRNETICKIFLHEYLDSLVQYSKTDNAEAVSILLEHDAGVWALEQALRRDFTEMAEVLQQVDSIKNDIHMCATCSINVGCYDCLNYDASCCNEKTDASYCRACALADNKFCGWCNEYLCPHCFAAGEYHACERCNIINCYTDSCGAHILACQECNREKCTSCALEDDGEWTDIDIGRITYCPDCSELIETKQMRNPSESCTVENQTAES